MACSDVYSSLVCLSKRKEIHWLWIFIPVITLVLCLLYLFSRSNYVRLSDQTYELLSSAQQKQLTRRRRIIPPRSTNQSNNAPRLWNEFRAPTLANYPDLIDAAEIKRLTPKPSSKLSEEIQMLIEKGFTDSDPNRPEIDLGRLWFFLEYNPYLRQLHLTIVKARDLRSVKNKQPNTFVQAELLPTLNLSFSTDIVRNNADPDYMTEAIFHLNLIEFPQNVLKLTVYEVEKDVFYTPIGCVYYPLDHVLLAQRAKGQMIWRYLLPDYGDPSAVGLIQIRATVWYDGKEEYLNIYIHSLRATGRVQELSRVYVHTAVTIDDHPIIPQEHLESTQIRRNQQGPLITLNEQSDTNYDQLFRFYIRQEEFVNTTVNVDVYRRSFGDEFFNDVLLGRTVLVSPEILEKKTSPVVE